MDRTGYGCWAFGLGQTRCASTVPVLVKPGDAEVSDRLLILLWHNVEGTWYHPSRPGAGMQGLTHQLKGLKRLATVVPLTSALDTLMAGNSLPRRAVALTFDDGYRDNLELAASLLQELELPATFFLIPGILSREVRPWWESVAWGFTCSSRPTVTWGGKVLATRGRLGRRSYLWVAERLKMLNRASLERSVTDLLELLAPTGEPNHDELFLDWDGARRLVRQGFAVGSHSMYHTVLSRETPDEQARNLAASRARLEAELGVPAELVAYPSGTRADYDASTVDAAKRAGHTYALAAHAGVHTSRTSPYAIPRFVMVPTQGFSEIVVRRVMRRLQLVIQR
jgi:peptidoglycan/xylan/chitin deacetylase (PgdA/CDA1 family)